MADPEADSAHFIAILVKCLALLEKLPLAVNVRKYQQRVSSIQHVVVSGDPNGNAEFSDADRPQDHAARERFQKFPEW